MTCFRRPITPFTHSLPSRSSVRWHPGGLVVAALLTLLVVSPAFSALRVGTKSSETLTGTKGNDHLTGAEGDDLLKGLAGNDTYFFADDWGADELVEKPGEGTDALNFHGVRTQGILVFLVREWDPSFAANAEGPGGTIDFNTAAGQATIEKVIGGQGDGDVIETGSGPHTLQPGGGALDGLYDDGGWNDGPGGMLEVPASDDLYKGFGDNTGTDVVLDFGGGGDVVDMRPFSTDDVYISREDFDSSGTEESLQIVTGLTSQVIIAGHFGEYHQYTSQTGQQGRIEKLIFADATFTSTNGLAGTAPLAKATSGKQATLAEAADRLAEEARAQLATMPEPGTLSGSGAGRPQGASKPGSEPAKPLKTDTKHTPATKDAHKKKPATRATHKKKLATKDTHEKKQSTKSAKPRTQRR
jgi:hypothetical protein